MKGDLDDELRRELTGLAGTVPAPRGIASAQGPSVRFAGGGEAICLASSDYLGLAANPIVIAAAEEGLRRYGAGTGSSRADSGLFSPHVELERDLADFLETERVVTSSSGWDANAALLEVLCDKRTWVFSDELNNPSIADGIRLARPGGRAVYAHLDVGSLDNHLDRAPAGSRLLIVTDGVFGTEGGLAPLADLADLAEARGATLIVDDSHGLGVLGLEGRGTAEHFGLDGRIDIITGSLGKALGGATGGFIAGSTALCELLEQRSRRQLHSTSLPPSMACAAGAALGELRANPGLLRRLRANIGRFRSGVTRLGLEPMAGESAIVPLVVGTTEQARSFSERLLREGVLATALGSPVVPEGAARVRAQISAGLSDEQIDTAIAAIGRVAGNR